MVLVHEAPTEARTEAPARPAPRDRAGTPIGRAVAIALAALLLAALLDAEALDDTARAQPFGWERDVAMAVTGPLVEVSRTLGLTEPRHWLEDVFGRPSTRPEPPVAMPAPPPAPSPTAPPSTVDEQPGTSGTPPPPTVPPRRRPTTEDPLRLLVAGDSMTESTGPAVLAAADATGVVAADHELRYSSGLTRPDYFDWPATLRALVGRQDPEAIVIMVGANDAQGIQTPSGPEPFGTEAWVAEYRARVAALMDELDDGERTVYWVGQPVMRSGSFDERMRLLTEVYRTEAARHPGVRFIDTYAHFAGADGAYSAYLPDASGRPVLVRRDDGIHLTGAGAERLAAVLMAAIDEDWELGG